MKILASSKSGTVTASMENDMLKLSIDGYIGKWEEANARSWKEKIDEYKNARKVLIYINSYGGEVFESNEMVNVISQYFTDVQVEVGAVAASAATYFLAKFPTKAKQNTQIMIHRPSVCVCGHIGKLESSAKLLRNLTEQYIKDYTAKMNITKEELEEKWQDDWWMTAQEALKYGLIDKIENKIAPVDQVVMAFLDNRNKPKSKYMNQVIAAKLGLNPGAEENEILSRIEQLQAVAKKAKELEKQMKQQAEAQKKAQIKALLDQAEKMHKITGEMREQFEELAEKDFERVKAVIESMPVFDKAPSANIKTGDTTGSRADWKYEDWAEKDPEGFERLPEEVQKKLIDEHFNN